MSDEADNAYAEIEQTLERARSKRYPTLIPSGRCNYCNSPLPPRLLFCNVECRDWWQDDQDALKRNGKIR